MSPMIAVAQVLLAAAAFTLSLAAVRWMIASGVGLYADVPNERSLHERVIPRGGGAGFVVSALVAWLLARVLLFRDEASLWYVAPFAAMAALGWADDRFDLAIAARLAVQLITASAAAIVLLDGIGGGFAWQATWFAAVVLALVWVTNLYNFMDGMDGLAASQAVMVLPVMGAWFAGAGDVGTGLFCAILAAATAGFLVFNWHPARVFMGDTGSLALGMAIAVLSVGGVTRLGLPPAAFAILMGVFLFDASYTLLRRMWRGERWWHSHRSHLYQRASALGISQQAIVASVVVINVVLAALSTALVHAVLPATVACVLAALVLAWPWLWVVRRESAAASRVQTP